VCSIPSFRAVLNEKRVSRVAVFDYDPRIAIGCTLAAASLVLLGWSLSIGER